MYSITEQVELAVGDELVAWLNRRQGTSFTFQERGNPAPDLIYKDGDSELPIEVVGAYYDESNASMLWQNARLLPNAPTTWVGVDFNRLLIQSIEARIREKCGKSYGDGCVLLVSIRPALTPMPNLQALLSDIQLPESVPFSAIYVAGDLPSTPHAQGGYFAWQVFTITSNRVGDGF